MEDLVSIIVPVYNGDFSVELSLKSLSNQTYSKIEIIIIDDGSSDQTQKVVEGYQKRDNRVILLSQENTGVSAARNKGIENAHGEYVCFLDCGDTYEHNFIEKMLSEIRKADYDYVYCGYNQVVNGKKSRQKITFTKKNLQINYLLNKTHPQTSCWLIKKDYLVKRSIKFPVGVQFSEDIEFYTEVMAYSKKYSYVADYLSNYHIDDQIESLSSYSIDKMDKDFESMIRISQRESMQDNRIQRAIFDYRLNALITFRFYEAIQRNEDFEVIQKYFSKYSDIIQKYSFYNGLRSIKLNIIKLKIRKIMRGYEDNAETI